MQSLRTVKKSLLFVIILSSLAPLIGCVPKPSGFGIIYVSDNGVVGASDIYRIPDNTQKKIEQLTFTPTIGEFNLLVSKHGDKIVFEAGDTELTKEPSEATIEKPRHIYLLDTASKRLEDITDILSVQPFGMFTMPVDWSPDQKQFAVITYDGDPGIMDFNGANKRLIPLPSLGKIPNINDIKWSPDGKKLLLIRKDVQPNSLFGNFGVLVYDLGNGKLSQLTNYQAGCYETKWSPTSQQAAVTCQTYAGPNTDMLGPSIIHILNPENPSQSYGNLALSSCWDTSWSPDGRQLAFECDKITSQEGLFTVNSDGSGFHEVNLGNLSNPAFLRYPTWSPDGRQIIYVAGTDYQHTNIYSVNADGSNNHLLTNTTAEYQMLSTYLTP